MLKRIRFLALLIGGASVLLASWAFGQGAPAYVPDEVLIKFQPGLPAAQRIGLEGELPAHILHDFGFIGVLHLKLEAGTTVEQAITRYRSDPRVAYVEPNYVVHAFLTPNDPNFPSMYGLNNTGQTGGTPGADIHAVNAWDLFTGDPTVKIAMIDTGIDYNHPDLVDNIWTNPGEIPGNHIDDDGNGYIDDVHGYDFANNDGDPFDDNFIGHGTHTAGTVAARGNNGIGVVGVNWRASLVAIKFLDSSGSGSLAGAIAGFQYAITVGARLTSNSWGGGGFSQALLDAINAAGAAGQLCVAAAGNASTNSDEIPQYPASYDSPYLISVAASDDNDELAGFSNYGATSVDLAAPGVDILSTQPGGGYQTLSGTSMATPHVAGVVALAMGRFPLLTNLQVKDLILRSVDVKPSLMGRVASNGRLNAFTTIAEPDTIPPGSITNLVAGNPGSSTMELSWTATGDDGGTGRASRYDIRYSTTPITQANFLSALAAVGPDPQPAGSAEHFEVTNLGFSISYYFAIQAMDEYGNRGPISNNATGMTLGVPHLGVSPASLSAALLTGATRTETLTLTNTGAGRLDFTVPKPTLIFGQHAAYPAASISKGAPDPRRGDPVAQGSGGPDGFGYRWVDSDEPGGPSFDWADITGVGNRVPISNDDETSVPVDMGINFPFYGNTFNRVRVCTNGFLSFTDNGAPFTNQPLPSGGAPRNLIAPLWDDLDFQGQSLAFAHNDGGRFIVAWVGIPHYGGGGPYTFEAILYPTGEIRYQYLALSPPLDGATVGIQNANQDIGLTVAFNSAYLHDHLAVRFSPLRQWLSVSPSSGRLLAGQSQNLDVRFDASAMFGGTYQANIRVLSNDPDDSPHVLGAELVVTGVQDIALSTNSLAFGPVFLGASRMDTLVVTNPGTDSLAVSEISSDHPDFAPAPTAFKLGPGGGRIVTVRFKPSTLGPAHGTLTLLSNDPDEGVLAVDLNGEGRPAPHVDAAPSSFEASLLTGEQAHPTLVLLNTGGSPLTFDITIGPAVTAAARPSQAAFSRAEDSRPLFGTWGDSHTYSPDGNRTSSPPRTASALPIVVNDPAGDGDPVDITLLRAISTGTQLQVEMEFGRPISPSNFGGFFSLDTDQNHLTGRFPSFGNPNQDIRVEYEVLMFRLPTGRVDLYNAVTGDLVGSYPTQVNPTSLAFSIPLSDLGNDDGRMDVSGVVGSAIGPTDWFPDSGHGTISNLGWITATPSTGSVAPGSSVNVDIGFDASGLPGGDYFANLVIAHNDPDQNPLTFPAHLHVTGAPDITLSQTTLDYGTVFIGVAHPETLVVTNDGTDTLRVTSLAVAPSSFTVNGGGFSLLPGEHRNVVVVFSPLTAGSIFGALNLHDNDPDEGSLSVRLVGAGLVAPKIGFSPLSFSATVHHGDKGTATLKITNSGGSPLDIRLDVAGHRSAGPPLTTTAHPSSVKRSPAEGGGSWAGLEPTANHTRPSQGPVAMAGEFTGTYLKFGISDYGEIVPYQYPVGNEHIAVGAFLSGYTVAYTLGGVPHVSAAGYDARTNIFPVSYRVLIDDPAEIVVEVVTQSENALQVRRVISFNRVEKYVRIRSTLINVSGTRLDAVVFKAWADWDVDGDFDDDNWDYDTARNMAYAYDTHYCAIAGEEAPTAMDVYGWNDVEAYATTVDYPIGPILNFDGLEVIHYDLGPLETSATADVVTAYGSGDNLAELQQVMDRAVPGVRWLSVTPAIASIASHSSMDFAVSMETADLGPGNYEADLTVQSNDPEQGFMTVPVSLRVTGATTAAEPALPLALGLKLVGANPAPGTAAFELALPKASEVSVSVHDVRGAIVAQLAHGLFAPGRHPLQWLGRDASGHRVQPGIYFVRMVAAGHRQTLRLVMIR